LVIKKNRIILEFDNDSIKELRKVLFKKGLCPQQFLTYIVEMAAIHDNRLLDMMDETITYKKHNSGS